MSGREQIQKPKPQPKKDAPEEDRRTPSGKPMKFLRIIRTDEAIVLT